MFIRAVFGSEIVYGWFAGRWFFGGGVVGGRS